MRCPYCASSATRVVDSRSAESGGAVRRRRTCPGCGQRFSTYERAEQLALTVGKRDGGNEAFDREKILAGIAKATANLDVDGDTVRRTLARVEGRVRAVARRRVSSETIGAEVLDALRGLHPVAALRFASVYKGFTSPEDFRRELARLDLDGHGVTLDAGESAVTEETGQAGTAPDAGESGAAPDAGESPVTEDTGQARAAPDAGESPVTEDTGQARATSDAGESGAAPDASVGTQETGVAASPLDARDDEPADGDR